MVVKSRPDQSLGSLEVSLTILSTQLAGGSSYIDAPMTCVCACYLPHDILQSPNEAPGLADHLLN